MKIIKKNKINKNEGGLDIILREIFRLDKKMDGGFDVVLREISRSEKKINLRIDELDASFNELQGAVDSYAKKADTYFQEMAMLAHKVDRLEKWILQLAEKAGLRLKS